MVAPTPRDARWWIGVIWLTVSVVLLCFVLDVTLFGAIQQTRTQAQLYQQLRDSLATATTPLGELDLSDHLVAEGTPVALISIPSLALSEVIVQGTSSTDLRAGPGHRPDSVMPGQAGTSVIFGKQSTYGGPFGQISALVPGDKITVTTGQGTSTFVVFGLRRPGDPLPASLDAGEGRLELVTADGPALVPDSTLYVDASLTSKTKSTPTPVFSHAALDPGENAMQSDPNALLPFLFSLQWLAIAAAITLWLSRKWGRWQAWIVGAPVLLILGTTTADCAIGLLPNLI
jgi:sortase A